MSRIRQTALIAGPLAGATLGAALNAGGLDFAAAFTAAVACWVAIWWIFEPIPIPASSLLPLALFPMAGVLTPTEVSAAYGHKLILLLLGGFILSTAMARSGAHRRLALYMVRLFGGGHPRRVLFGFMAATGLLSMWISNTATTLMMLPVAMAVLAGAANRDAFAPVLLLAIAYSASVGGMGTPIGTPPNLAFLQAYETATGSAPGFLQWMLWAMPVAAVMLLAIAWWLSRGLSKEGDIQLPEVGAWQSVEKRVLIVFALTALAWVLRKEPFGGWSGLLGLPNANDASIALLAVVVMFLVPDGRGSGLLDWDTAVKIPWGILLLYGGGLTIAAAFKSSGLSLAVGELLSGVGSWPILLTTAAICLLVTFLTELTSNTATTVLLLPVLAAAAVGADLDPLLLMLPATLTASCAFMLPVATAPNAIVFGTGEVSVARMARTGLVLNLTGVALIAGLGWLLW